TSITLTKRMPYDVQTFDPATGHWQDCFPAGKEWLDCHENASPPGFGHSGNYVSMVESEGNNRLTPTVPIGEYCAFDAEDNFLHVALGAPELRGSFASQALPIISYNVAERTWEELRAYPRSDLAPGSPFSVHSGILSPPLAQECRHGRHDTEGL